MQRISNVKIVMLESLFEQIKDALHWGKGGGKERAAYLLCNRTVYEGKLKLMPYQVFVPEEKDYVSRSAGHCELDKPFIDLVINTAIADQADVILSHIHPPYYPAKFSPVDDKGDKALMGHIADKVNGIGQGALVFGNDMQTIDARYYDRDTRDFLPVDKVVVVGKNQIQILLPGKSKLNGRKLGGTLDRTVSAFGTPAVEMLGLLDFGVVGASALGGPILEILARDRVGSITICDPDTIEESNLNRLVAATDSDIGKPKVSHYAEYLAKITPEVPVSVHQKSFYESEVQAALSYVDVIFGCVDSGARFSINQLACANLIPYFDLGAAIVIENGTPEFIGGQVYSIIPGREVCLSCAGVFENLRNDYLSPMHRKMEIEQGYIKSDEDVIARPLVMFLDYMVAGLGYQQMLEYIWGMDKLGLFSVNIDTIKRRMMSVTCKSKSCIVCGSAGYLGMGDKVPAKVPATDNDISNIPMANSVDESDTSDPADESANDTSEKDVSEAEVESVESVVLPTEFISEVKPDEIPLEHTQNG